MKKDIILSIIVPVYNGEKYIDRCISEVQKEYIDGVELILVNDGSKDNSLDKCNYWSSLYNWIKVFHHENQGVSYTRNRGIREAEGKFIWFVDVDDVILSGSVKAIFDIIKEKKSDIILFGYKSKLARKQLSEFNTYPMEEGLYEIIKSISEIFWGLFERNLIHNIGNKIYRKELIDNYDIKFDEKVSICEDAMFCIDVMRVSKSIWICSKVWYCYNLEENMQSLNHIYRRNYFYGMSLLYENINQLVKEDDEFYYQSYIGSVLDVIRNEFRKKKFSYSNFCEFVDVIIHDDKVENALEYVQRQVEINSKWKKILKRKYLECYLQFKVEQIINQILVSKTANRIFDILYCIYKGTIKAFVMERGKK